MWGIEKPFLARLNELDSPKEKRGVVMLTRDKWEDWLACRDPEVARTFLSLHPAELMGAEPAPPENTAPRKQKPPGSGDLF
jgi:putative SOS response-associated peptidase YedK